MLQLLIIFCFHYTDLEVHNLSQESNTLLKEGIIILHVSNNSCIYLLDTQSKLTYRHIDSGISESHMKESTL